MRHFFPPALRIGILALSFLAAAWALPALTPGSELVPSGHWVYDSIAYLSLEAGQTTLAVFAPASKNELRSYLDSIPVDRLGPVGAKLYRRALAFLSPSGAAWITGAACADIRPEISLTLRRHTDADALFDSDFLREYTGTKPALSLPCFLGFGPYAAIFSGFDVQQGYWASTFADDWVQVPLSADDFDMTVPATAYASLGNSSFNFSIGRGSLSSGRTATGSMILSDTADRLNYALASFFSPALRVALTTVELDTDRFLYYHDISFRPVPFLSFILSESASVHSTLDLRYLNPAMIYHSYAGWKDEYAISDAGASPVGTQFAFAAEAVPLRGLRLYGQFVMNQFQTSYEQENFGEGAAVIPNSLGGLAGAEYAREALDGMLTVSLEGIYTNPWLYIMENGPISYYWSRRDLVAPSGYTTKHINGWMGSPFGPDTIAALFSLGYERPSEWGVSASYRFVCRGENGTAFFEHQALSGSGDFYPTTVDEASISTPSGDPSYQHRIGFGGTLERGRLAVGGEVGYSLLYGALRAASFDIECSASWSLR